MGTSQAFGRMADMIYSMTFDPSDDEATVVRTVLDIEAYAEAAGIELTTSQYGRTFHFQFVRPADYMVLRDFIAERDNAPVSAHTETFERCAPEFVAAWVYEARRLLQDAGIKHRVIEHADGVTFELPSNGALMMFASLRDAGYLTAKAHARLNTTGPVPAGSIPY